LNQNNPTLVFRASIGLAFGGALWGLMWLPIRALADLGLWGAWPTVLIYGATVALVSPVILWRLPKMARRWPQLLAIGLLVGAAFNCYTASLLLTDVVRALLLFYLTPVWGTLLGIVFLGERLTVGRIAAIVLGFGGLLVILGTGGGWPWPRNIGDWLALASGLFWAVGSLRLYQMGSVAVLDQMCAFLLGGFFVTLVMVGFGGPTIGGPLPEGLLRQSIPYGIGFALYFIPVLFLTIWPATVLSPGRAGLILMSEVVVGVASAAILTDEPFGVREICGTLLIITAAAVEILWKSKPVPSANAGH
jgi:drug/metabolite transporter (DMT)-like permease